MSQEQLASQVAESAPTLDIALLESGQAEIPQRETLEALAVALEWPVGLLEVASGGRSRTSIDAGTIWHLQGQLHEVRERDQMDIVQEELTALHELQEVLSQWAVDLADYIRTLKSLVGPWTDDGVRND
jgi:hypothetical protein